MTVFADSSQLYAAADALFARMLQEHPQAIKPLYRSRLVARMKTWAPTGELLVNAHHNPLQTTFGPSTAKAEIEIELAADDLHRILLGELKMTKALGRGAITLRGPVFKAAPLAALFRRGQDIYPLVLQELGIQY